MTKTAELLQKLIQTQLNAT